MDLSDYFLQFCNFQYKVKSMLQIVIEGWRSFDVISIGQERSE